MAKQGLPVCSDGLLTAHYLFDQSDDHHQDTPAGPAGYNLADDRADIEAARASAGGFGSAANQRPDDLRPDAATDDASDRVA